MQKQLSRLDYFTLKVLIGLFEFKNGSLVAEKLNSTQPKVSRALSNMREVLHDELFIRQQYGLQPNAMAERLYPFAKNIIVAYDQMAIEANTQPEHHQTLHIGVPEQMSKLALKSIEETSQRLGLVHTVHIHPWTESSEHLLIQRKLDFAVSSRVFRHENVINKNLGLVNVWFLAVRKNHPILQKEITLEALLNYRLVFLNYGPLGELTEAISQCCKIADKKADISLITSSISMAFEHIVDSDDVCWAPSVFPYELSKQRDDIELINVTSLYEEYGKQIMGDTPPSHILQFHESQNSEFSNLLNENMQKYLKSYQDDYAAENL